MPVNPSELSWNVLIVTDAPKRLSALEDAVRAHAGTAVRVPSHGLLDTPGLERFTAAFVDLSAGERAAAALRPIGIPFIAVGNPAESAEVLAAIRLGARDFVGPAPSAPEIEASLRRLGAAPSADSGWIEYRDERDETLRLRLAAPRVTVGRDPASDVRFEASTVSRYHAEILSAPDGHRVVDAGSRHGVFVNGIRVTERILVDGDQVRLGGSGAPVLHYHGGRPSGNLETVGTLTSLAGASNREIKHIATLLDAFLSLKGDLRFEDILEIVIDRAIEVVDADRGMILLLEPPAVSGRGRQRKPLRGRLAARDRDADREADREADRDADREADRDADRDADREADRDTERQREREPESQGAGEGPEDGMDDGEAAAGGQRTCELRLAMARNRDGTAIDASKIQISRKIPEGVIRTGCGAILEDLLAPEQLAAHQGTIEIGVRSAMCVPLLTRKTQTGPDAGPQVLGVLYVDSASQKKPYSPRLLEAFESLAAEAAQAIFNARMYKLSMEKRRIDEEMGIARAIQQSFLPPAHHESPRFALHGHTEPSLEVGGDFFSYYPLECERLGIVVGDVSGKGIPAAIFASFLDGVCYGLAAGLATGPELGRLAGVLNRHLVTKTAHGRFVSLFFAMLFPDGRLAFVNAGHNPPLRIGRDGAVEMLATGGMILGMIEEAAYEVKETTLATGDAMVLYSDGITEARRAGGEAFGTTRLRDAAVAAGRLDARGIHEAILESLEEFLDGARPTDDVTLLIVKYR